MNTITSDLFIAASQLKLRYPYKGSIGTEDLWDLTLPQLDVVYKALSKELNNIDGEDSLLSTKSSNYYATKNEVEMKIEIVRYIFNRKQEASDAARADAERAAKKQHILEVLAAKQEDALQNMSEEDLMKMLDDLG